MFMNKVCKKCGDGFLVREEDLEFYGKVSPVFNGVKYGIPAPTFCPDCRQQRRLCFNNEMNLYKRKCDFSGKEILSVFSQDKPYAVYEAGVWWSDKWDALDYGRDFDFSRPFFEQFDDLLKSVPLISLFILPEFDVNSEYTNNAGNNKDCYLIFHADFNELCFYGYGIKKCQSCMDCYNVTRCELCYECVQCKDCYNLFFSQDCNGCSDSYFLKDCVGCKNCFACNGLHKADFCFMNKQLSKEEYGKKLKEIDLIYDSEKLESGKKYLWDIWSRGVYKNIQGVNLENCSGNYLDNCKNCHECFDCDELEDCKFCYQVGLKAKDCYDYYQFGLDSELMYECSIAGYNNYLNRFCHLSIQNSSNNLYCFMARAKNCFGCVSVVDQEFCVLNKKYSEEEYNKLVPKIIEHMRKTHEWGEFFPAEISTFNYDETNAQLFFPREGFTAHKPKNGCKASCNVPSFYKDIPDNIVDEILACRDCGKNYKIIPKELEFLRKCHLPLPIKCFSCRNKDRMALRNPRKLFDRKCDKCGIELRSSYSPDRSEKVFCEECYLTYVYE